MKKTIQRRAFWIGVGSIFDLTGAATCLRMQELLSESVELWRAETDEHTGSSATPTEPVGGTVRDQKD